MVLWFAGVLTLTFGPYSDFDVVDRYYLAMCPWRKAASLVVKWQMLQSNPFVFFTSLFITPPYLFTSLLPVSCTSTLALTFALALAVLNLVERGW